MRRPIAVGGAALLASDSDPRPEPPEWRVLRERLALLPVDARNDLQPALDAAIEHACFRQKVVDLAREALEQSRLERALLEFDLEVTRREHAELRRRYESED